MALPSEPDGSTLRQAAEEYIAAGLSIVPVLRGDKRPNYPLLIATAGDKARWEQYQTMRPTPIRLGHWLSLDPQTSIAIVGGAISGNLVILDVDHPPFCAWLLQHMELLSRTWTVQTGSGKLHLYVRNPQPVPSTVFRLTDGTKILDFRSEGEYVVAPPSVHASGGTYRTLCGGPTKIPQASDALLFAKRLLQRYEQDHGGVSPMILLPSSPVSTVPAPVWDTDEMRDALRRMRSVSVPTRVRNALVYGAQPATDPWPKQPSKSEIDYVMCLELLSAGFSRADIESTFKSFPWGKESAYNGQQNRGDAYLRATLDKAEKKISEEAISAKQLLGDNFEVVSALRLMGTPPSYELVLRDTQTDETGKVFISYEDLWTERKFRFAVLGQMPRLLPRLKHHHSGKNWDVFVQVLSRFATLEAVPDEATSTGHLRATIVGILTSYRIYSLSPQTPGDIVLGWRDQQNSLVYFRGAHLLNVLGQVLRQMPAPDKVWTIIRGLGGTSKRAKIGTTSETLWIIPTQSLDRR